jgi:DnaJ-class molecular chaperone
MAAPHMGICPRPRWWPPACASCRGFGYRKDSETQRKYGSCARCGGTGHAVSHDEWTRRRIAGLEP